MGRGALAQVSTWGVISNRKELTLAGVPSLLAAKGEVTAGSRPLLLLRQALGTLRAQLAQLHTPSRRSHTCQSF